MPRTNPIAAQECPFRRGMPTRWRRLNSATLSSRAAARTRVRSLSHSSNRCATDSILRRNEAWLPPCGTLGACPDLFLALSKWDISMGTLEVERFDVRSMPVTIWQPSARCSAAPSDVAGDAVLGNVGRQERPNEGHLLEVVKSLGNLPRHHGGLRAQRPRRRARPRREQNTPKPAQGESVFAVRTTEVTCPPPGGPVLLQPCAQWTRAARRRCRAGRTGWQPGQRWRRPRGG